MSKFYDNFDKMFVTAWVISVIASLTMLGVVV